MAPAAGGVMLDSTLKPHVDEGPAFAGFSSSRYAWLVWRASLATEARACTGITGVCTEWAFPAPPTHLTHRTMRVGAWLRGSRCAWEDSNPRPAA
jgi:hypothetical protein